MAYNFDQVAASYDRMNRLMTLGLDRLWRRKAVGNLVKPCSQVLDVACGTGDMLVELAQRGHTAAGVDLSEEMMAIARTKGHFNLIQANAEQLPFGNEQFDAVTCAFGVRNFVHLNAGLAEMLRVMKPAGRMVILELATPDKPLTRFFYHIYTRHLIPLLGELIAGNRDAYTYLPLSIEHFPKGKQFVHIVEQLGATCHQRKLTFGVCRLYLIEKNKEVATD